jgi:bacterioferritin-associated ferredoxin
MIVCLCHRISDRDIVRAVREGVPDFETLQEDTCIARNCGCCHETALEVFEQAMCENASACGAATGHRVALTAAA